LKLYITTTEEYTDDTSIAKKREEAIYIYEQLPKFSRVIRRVVQQMTTLVGVVDHPSSHSSQPPNLPSHGLNHDDHVDHVNVHDHSPPSHPTTHDDDDDDVDQDVNKYIIQQVDAEVDKVLVPEDETNREVDE
jgi:hypothetical protein